MKASVSAILHQENDWLKELEFYKEEMYILTARIEEVNKKNTSIEILSTADDFLKRLFALRLQLDQLKQDIGTHTEKISQIAKERPTHIHEKAIPENEVFFNKVKTLIQNIADIRFEFNTFLSKVF